MTYGPNAVLRRGKASQRVGDVALSMQPAQNRNVLACVRLAGCEVEPSNYYPHLDETPCRVYVTSCRSLRARATPCCPPDVLSIAARTRHAVLPA